MTTVVQEILQDKIYLDMSGQLQTHGPSPGDFDSYQMSGTIAEALFPPGSTTPSWLINASVSIQGGLSAVVSPSGPAGITQEIDGTFNAITTLNQTEARSIGGPASIVTGTVTTTAGFRDVLLDPGPVGRLVDPGPVSRESFSVQDQINIGLLDPGPISTPTAINAVFTGAGTLIDSLADPGPVNTPLLIGVCQLSGRLQETITSPSPTGGTPSGETLTFIWFEFIWFERVS
jgi:hypothetical protein